MIWGGRKARSLPLAGGLDQLSLRRRPDGDFEGAGRVLWHLIAAAIRRWQCWTQFVERVVRDICAITRAGESLLVGPV